MKENFYYPISDNVPNSVTQDSLDRAEIGEGFTVYDSIESLKKTLWEE